MKTTIQNFAMLVLAILAPMTFAACSGGDDPSVDDILSDKTTPVTFELDKGTYFMYDYAGSSYVGGDTIRVSKKSEVKRNLRQGPHSLLWLTEPYFNDGKLYETHYDAKRKMLVRNDDYPALSRLVRYAVSEINVSEYLLPTQTLTYSTPMSAIFLYVEDADRCPVTIDKDWEQIGVLKGYPNIKSVSLTGNEYERAESVDLPIYYFPHSGNKIQIMGADDNVILCPRDGLDNIQLSIEIKGADGNVIVTSQLPRLSFRRGESIRLQGTLFSGSSSDWREMQD